MNRRRFLGGVAAGLLAGGAGCLSAPTARPSGSRNGPPVRSVAGADLPVSRDDLFPAIHSVIPAIVDPAFATDWSDVERREGYEPRLTPEDPVIGVDRDGRARAYPLSVLEWHEVVNDDLGGPLLVTYCPSCGSGMTAERRVGGREATFEVSHLLWRGNLVLRDLPTGSLWSQLTAAAIRGPATGETLSLVPSTLSTWSEWRAVHPDSAVLLPPPHSKTISGPGYGSYSYDRYTESAAIIGRGEREVTSKTLVLGITARGEAKAYPFPAVREAGVVNDTVGGQPVVVAPTADGSMVAYERRLDGTVLRFRPGDGRFVQAGGSRWSIRAGRAVDGPHEDAILRRANDLPPLFWFAWSDFHPETALYGRDA